MSNNLGFYTKMKTAAALARGAKLVKKVRGFQSDAKALEGDALAAAFKGLASEKDSLEKTAKAFAFVREAAARTLGTPHYDVQLIGGLALYEGFLAEMRTGEGKTLTITLAAALRALEGKGVHVVTANEYLAARDAELMAPVYKALGLSVAVTLSNMSVEDKQSAYRADITYGVGAEFGFDYLKDNMVRSPVNLMQRGLHAAIVDEVDSILIDEARVPLIISDSAEDLADLVRAVDACVKQLKAGEHYHVNLKEQSAELTEAGYHVAEEALEKAQVLAGKSLYADSNLHIAKMLHSAVKAYGLFRRDRDYVVRAGELVLVDTGTGRAMEGRRLNDGLHEALEAREGLEIKKGTVTRATITYQSYFGLYAKLAGLSGTAATDAEEFADMYGLVTVVIPTNKKVIRTQAEDLLYRTRAQKFSAAVEIVAEKHAAGQPVLVGCATIRDAELMDSMLSKAGIAHQTLTAKYLDREADIIAQAGKPGAVTVATNMAGRGTDIHLGGLPPSKEDFEDEQDFQAAKRLWEIERDKAVSAGGLFVLGTERNGLRRVDNQLAGRSGRQGNPGHVQFLLSLEDELLRVFAGSRQVAVLSKAMEQSDTALGGSTVARLITTAQKSVEMQGFSARKSLLTFDQTIADQRNAVYSLRTQLLNHGALDYLRQASLDAVTHWTEKMLPRDSFPEMWDVASLKADALDQLGLELPLLRWVNVEELDRDDIVGKIQELATAAVEKAELQSDEDARALIFEVLDDAWTHHLTALAELQSNALLKGSAQQNAALKFPKEAFDLFLDFQVGLERALARLTLEDKALKQRQEMQAALKQAKEAERQATALVSAVLQSRWVSRNEPCPCGSGKHYKHCHGALPL